MTVLEVDVVGIPQPQGSARAFRRGARILVTSDNPQLHSWRELVTYAVAQQRGPALPLHGPLAVRAVFRLPRPKTRRKATHHTTRPDLDKLTRAIGDALTGLVFTDDAAIVEWQVAKRYVTDGELPGVRISVSEFAHCRRQ